MSDERARELFTKAMEFYQDQDYKNAIETFKEVIYDEPQFHEALYNLACCMAVTGQKDQAVMYLNRACKLSIECSEWAREDKEFDSIRKSEMFQKIIGGKVASAENGDAAAPAATNGSSEGLSAVIATDKGEISLNLFDEDTPLTVANFVNLSQRGFYNGLKFHRVIKDFMIQGGCPFGTGTGGPGYKFKDEFVKELRHDKPGILSMANSGKNTNGSQFFVTHKATPWLDDNHTVFGEVASDMDQEIVNSIKQGDKIESIVIEGNTEPLMQKMDKQIKEWNKILDKKFSHLK